MNETHLTHTTAAGYSDKVACTWSGCGRNIGINGVGGHMRAHRAALKLERRGRKILAEAMMTSDEAAATRIRSHKWALEHEGPMRSRDEWIDDFQREYDRGDPDEDCSCGCDGDIETHVKVRILSR